MNEPLELTLLPDVFAVCRLGPGAEVPSWAMCGGLLSATWTDDETSIVCADTCVPAAVRSERGWRALRVAGPLDFSLTGVLAAIAVPLADAGVPIFALSTFDTDYVLLRADALDAAVEVLVRAGHRVSRLA